jgi:hypothetical protein
MEAIMVSVTPLAPASAHAIRARICTLVLILALLVTQLSGLTATRTQALDPLTIGGLILFGQVTLDKIDSITQNALNTAGQQVRQSVSELRAQIQTMIKELEQAYQENLNITINTLDAITATKLAEMQTLIEKVNQKLQEDINLIQQATKDVINTGATQARQLMAELQQRLTNVVVVTTEAVVFVVDRALFNVVLIVSLIMLGIGLLLFVWLTFSGRLPQGIMRPIALTLMIAYVVVFGSLALVPRVRAQVMSAAGLGLEKQFERVTTPVPEVVGVEPRLITLGETASIRMIGVGLRPEGKTVTAKIGTVNVPVSAAAEREAVLNTSALNIAEGSHEAILLFDGTEAPKTRALVEVKRKATPIPPPDLTISNFTISPSSPTVGANATATVSVRNQGGSAAGAFFVRWKPFATHPGITKQISGVAVGGTASVTFDFAYTNAATVDSVADADSTGAIAESNEGNNGRTLNGVVVKAAPPKLVQITVRFTSIKIDDDADPFGSGEMFLNFNVGGIAGRFPSTGTRDVNNGDTVTINKDISVTIPDTQSLSVFVTGTDEDNPPIDNHDPLGDVSRTYFPGNNWSAGGHSERSTCPDGCYTISYTITVVRLN